MLIHQVWLDRRVCICNALPGHNKAALLWDALWAAMSWTSCLQNEAGAGGSDTATQDCASPFGPEASRGRTAKASLIVMWDNSGTTAHRREGAGPVTQEMWADGLTLSLKQQHRVQGEMALLLSLMCLCRGRIRESLLAQSLAVPLDHGRDTVILNKNRTLKKKQ